MNCDNAVEKRKSCIAKWTVVDCMLDRNNAGGMVVGCKVCLELSVAGIYALVLFCEKLMNLKIAECNATNNKGTVHFLCIILCNKIVVIIN